MKHIDLTKYGFVRFPDDDFFDDSGKFTCYKVGKVRVYILIYEDKVYLSGDIPNLPLPCEIYSKLSHYKAVEGDYNGIPLSSLTDYKIRKFYDACVAYDKEVEETMHNIHYPTLSELEAKAQEILNKYHDEYTEISAIISKMPSVLIELHKKSKYDFESFMDAYTTIYEKANMIERVDYILNTAYSFGYMEKEVKDSWYYKHCLMMLGKEESICEVKEVGE